MESTHPPPVISAITNIKVPGIATMTYWSIIETQGSIYFVRTSTALGLGVGTSGMFMAASVIGDIVGSRSSKKTADQDLNTILHNAEWYIGYDKQQAPMIKIKKRLFGGATLIVPNGNEKSWKEAGFIKFKISKKKYKMLSQMLERLNQ